MLSHDCESELKQASENTAHATALKKRLMASRLLAVEALPDCPDLSGHSGLALQYPAGDAWFLVLATLPALLRGSLR